MDDYNSFIIILRFPWLKIVVANNSVYTVCTMLINGLCLLKHSKHLIYRKKSNVYSNNTTKDECSSIWSMSSQGKWQMILWSNNISKARNRKLSWIEVLCVWIHACLHVQLVSWLWVLQCGGWVKSSLMNETSRLMKRTASLPLAHTLKHTDTNTLRMQHNMQGQPLYMMLKIIIFSLLRTVIWN